MAGATMDLHGREEVDLTKHGRQVVVAADFGKWIDYPLVKTKFGAYNSGYVPGYVDAYKRDLDLFDEVRPDSLRFDGGLGSPRGIIFHNPPMISGTPPDVHYDFRQVDALLNMLNAHNVAPYWCYSYVPENLVEPGQNFRHPPSDLDAWADVINAVASHFQENDHFIGYHEIYNEPDNRDFFLGTKHDYFAMYERAVRAIRAVDPEAKVGGPALAFSDSWIAPFLDHVTEAALPLDFFSFHFYPGNPYKAENVRGVVETVRDELARRPEYVTTEMHLNEYNSLPINYPEDGPQQKHALAAALLNDFSYFVSEPSLTKVHWAQFMDTAGGNWSGMISVGGARKAVFNAYRIYGMMPVDRSYVSVDGPTGIGAMASSNDHKAGLVVWNRSGSEQTTKLVLNHIPFETGTVEIYRIDADNASWGDNPANETLIPIEVHQNARMDGVTWTGKIPDGGVLYVQADDGTGTPEFDPADVGTPLQVLHYYPDRKKRTYADFDRNTWIARLGMAGEEEADARIGVLADRLAKKLVVSMKIDGELTKLDSNSLLGVRLDYRVGGDYTSSVLFHGPYNDGPDLYSSQRSTSAPWGSPFEGEIVTVPNTAEFDIDVLKYAPADWAGKAVMTFILQNAGPDVRAKIIARPTR